jgi:DNA-binding beta-propeller fold protein YncE
MPPLPLTSLLQNALPWLSTDGRAVVNTLICNNGRIDSTQALCQNVGLRNRFQLSRLLRREGLPPYEELSGWVCVLCWMLRADAGIGRGALLALARQTAMQIATCYRLVRRVTGYSWKDLRRAGTAEVLRLFQRRVQPARARRVPVRPIARLVSSPATDSPRHRAPAPSAAHRRLYIDGAPYGIAVRGDGLAYVALGHAATIASLDLRGDSFTRHIPVGCTPTCVTFDPTGILAYATIQFCDEIAIIDPQRHAQVGTMPVPGDPFPLLISATGRVVYATTNVDCLWALSAPSGRVLGSLALPATSHHLALHPAGDRLYVATRAAGSVLEVDANRLRVLRSFPLGGWPQGMVVSPDGTMLYVANEQRELDVVQLSSGKCVARVEQARGAVSLAASPNHRLLYAAHPREGRVSVIDIPSLTPRGTLATGGRPGQTVFDHRARAIITNEGGWVDLLPIGELRVAAA